MSSMVTLFNSTDPLVRAVAAHLARYKGLTRSHTESDLRIYLRWCAEHRLDPLQAERAHIELGLPRVWLTLTPQAREGLVKGCMSCPSPIPRSSATT